MKRFALFLLAGLWMFPPCLRAQEEAGRLEQSLKEAQASLTRWEDPAVEASLPEGIAPSELADRRRTAEQTVAALTRALKTNAAAADAKNTLQQAQAAEEAWSGFPESPPYSILMLDELFNQRDAAREKAQTYQSSVKLLESSLQEILEDAKASEETKSRLVNALEGAAGSGTEEGLKWRLEATEAKSRLLAARTAAVQSNLAVLRDQLEAAKLSISLLDRQIEVVSRDFRVGEEDLEKVKKAAQDRQSALREEISKMRTQQRAATREVSAAQASLESLLSASQEAPPQETEGVDEVALARLRVETAKGRGDALLAMIDHLESLVQLAAFTPEAYQLRKRLADAQSVQERKEAVQEIRDFGDQVAAWKTFAANELSSVRADLSRQEARSSSLASDDPRLPLLEGLRSVLWESQAVLQRSLNTLDSLQRLIGHWLAAYDDSGHETHWYSKLTESAGSGWEVVRNTWDFSVRDFEQTTMVGDQKIVTKKSVTVGMIVGAICVFAIGYAIASRLSRRIQSTLVSRGRIAMAQANTLRNWLMIVVSFFLVIAALNVLNIPLTIFAFLGGALAIGIGFGTQTLIKNFISGIIVLFERSFRVGDVLTVNGITGSVVEINTRSSVLAGGNGEETVIPNSVFLENHVTNQTLHNRQSRRTIRVGVEYGAAPQQVIELLLETVDRHGLVLKTPAPAAFFEDFGENALLFSVYFWVEFNAKTNASAVESDIRIMIDKRFKEVGIGFPYPQRDVHLRTPDALNIRMESAPEQETPPP